MWSEKNALTLAETYFRKDEKYLFVEILPWYYCFSFLYLFWIIVYGLALAMACYLFNDIPVVVCIGFIVFGACILYYGVTRSIYPNYLIISQHSVYRFILKNIRQFDEIPIKDIEGFRIRSILFSNERAVLTIKCNREYRNSRPERRRKYMIRHAQENPEKVNPRFLASRKATKLRVVVRKPDEYGYVLNELRHTMGYQYEVETEGKRND